MASNDEDDTWIQRGKQKRAVALALTRPMTATEILERVQQILTEQGHKPRTRLVDVSKLLITFQARGLTYSVYQAKVIGTLHFLTTYGRRIVHRVFQRIVHEPPSDMDWELISSVVRAKTRKAVLLAFLDPGGDPLTLTVRQIKERLQETYPMSVYQIVRAKNELVERKLIVAVDMQGTSLIHYRLSEKGRKMSVHLSYEHKHQCQLDVTRFV